MMPRRDLVTSGVLAGVFSALAGRDAAAAPAAEAQTPEQAVEHIARAIADLRAEVRDQRQFSEIAAIRDAQKEYLHAYGKLPDYIDVGADAWFRVHDWHVRWRQPLAISRDPLGRYTIVLLQTLVVLRTDMPGSFVGPPYDAH